MHTPTDLLKEYGLKVTAPRLAVLAFLSGKHMPASAQDIHAKLAPRSRTDLVTVYRTLASFEKAGLVKRVDLRTDAVHYELSGRHHHHIVCTACGIVEDFEQCTMADLAKRIAAKAKHFTTVREHTLELFGVCNSCAEA